MSAFRKAVRKQAKLRLALIGPSGSGKTFSSMAIATALVPGGRIAVIDSERKSAELYANKFEFDTLDLERHSPLDYVAAIELAEREGYDVIVCDSLSHAWMGKGGALEQVDQAVERGAGNSFSAWRQVTPKHMQLVDKILSCNAHFIATIRAKTAYVQEKNEKGKTEIKKLGMEAVQRDGLEYEFTLVGDLDLTNTLRISKTRLDGVIMPGDMFERPGAVLGEKIRSWLNDGAEAVVEQRTAPLQPAIAAVVAALESTIADPQTAATAEPPTATTEVSDAVDETFKTYLDGLMLAVTIKALEQAAKANGRPAKGTPNHAKAIDVFFRCKETIEKRAKAVVEAVGQEVSA
jgi:hypothetical protein